MELAFGQYPQHSNTVWTEDADPAHTRDVLPWSCIERLRDHFGDYVIVVSCRTCGHSREMTPAFLARHCRAGWNEPLANIVARFRCRCGKKLVDVQIGFNHKPRGWVKNPS
jgi:hypothetical protein